MRFSTFNASLNRSFEGQLIADLSTPGNVQASNVAEIVQRVRPDVLLINEFDYDSAGTALRLFQDNYLSVPHNGAAAIEYPYAYTAPSNTGIHSGYDLDNNGVTNSVRNTRGYGEDALGSGESFVIAGDQNSDPLDGDSIPGSIQQLLDSSRVNASVTPSSPGGVEAAQRQGFRNLSHRSPPAEDTADFCDTPAFPPCSGPGNLRADYVLPSADLLIRSSGILWPTSDDPLHRLTGPGFPVPSSDHRAVWVDVKVPGVSSPSR